MVSGCLFLKSGEACAHFLSFPWQPCDVYKAPHSSAGKSALLQPRHKQSALITHYTALHSTPFTCNIWGCVLVRRCVRLRASSLRWFRLCTMNCEHSGLNLLVAVRLSVSNLVNELYGQIVCWCYLGPCNLALSRPTVKFREVLLSAWCGAPTMSTQPITSPSAINMYAVLLLSLSMPLWRTWWSQPTPCQGEGHSRNWV